MKKRKPVKKRPTLDPNQAAFAAVQHVIAVTEGNLKAKTKKRGRHP